MKNKEVLIKETAKKVLETMDKKSKEKLLKFEPIDFHFSLGLYIRNKCIYGHSEFDEYEPDSISQEIIQEIQEIVKGEYNEK